MNFKPSKRKLDIFVILFFLSYVFLPVVKCIDDHAAAEKFCQQYGICEVDYYFSLATLILHYDGEFLCPATNISGITMVILTLL